MLQKLPLGLQDFAKLRNDNHVYVDKTEIIYNLVTSKSYVFLSRPRRFGKSLLLSTIKALYEGKKSLFEGLWVEDKWDWEKKHPVLLFSMFEMKGTSEPLSISITTAIDTYAEEYGIILKTQNIAQKFKALLKALSEQHGRVVVLIDEYDKPMIDYITDEENLEKNKNVLRDFYGILKDSDPYLEYVMLTGVSKFSKVSIFSSLNNMIDITIDKRYGAICGYTQPELKANFMPYFEALAKENELTIDETFAKTKIMYNGYFWAGKETLYSPFSTLWLLDKRIFSNFWFGSGRPKFIVDLLKKDMKFDFKGIMVNLDFLENSAIESLNSTAVMFQTGYLTITDADVLNDCYTLDYPNQEVRVSMLSALLLSYSQQPLDKELTIMHGFQNALRANDLDALFEEINALFGTIPYEIFLAKQEAYFHSIIYLVFSLLGYRVKSEVSVHKGRIDLVLETETHTYIIEFKVDKSAEIALQQIKNRNYYTAFLNKGKQVVIVGANLNSETKGVDEWLAEDV